MKMNEILQLGSKIRKEVYSNELFLAFQNTFALSESLMLWELTEEIKAIEKTYRLVLHYAVNNFADESRKQYLEGVKDRLLAVLDKILIAAYLRNNSTDLYFSALRFSQTTGESLKRLLDQYASLKENNSAEEILQRHIEEIQKRIFNLLWVSFPLSSSDIEVLKEQFPSDSDFDPIQGIIISSLFLGTLKFYDQNKLELLLEIYLKSENERIQAEALTAVVILLFTYDRRTDNSHIEELIKKASKNNKEEFGRRINLIIKEIVRTRETERINKKFQEDILPSMMKFGPKFNQKFGSLDEDELASLEENPQWRDMIEKSGLADSLKEMNELQMEGADVMMSTFGNLKNFPFFNEPVNWFLPFDVRRTEIRKSLEDLGNLGKILVKSYFLCDSDKYSLLMAFGSFPDLQRNAMKASMSEQFKAMEEMMENKEAFNDWFLFYVNKYIQNLFRFFKLFRRKNEFYDPFKKLPNPLDVKLLLPFVENGNNIRLLAEFNLKHGYWPDAFRLYDRLLDIEGPNAPIYQKMGFARQKEGELEDALNYYMQADLLESDDPWTLKRIAVTSRLLGNWSTALNYYKKLDSLQPDNPAVALAIGKCCLELDKYADAVQWFYKADYLDPDSKKVRRGLAWALVMNQEFEAARKNYLKLMEQEPSAEDFLNLGHLELLELNYTGAIENYIKAARKGKWDTQAVIEHLDPTFRILRNLEPEIQQSLIIDELLYRLQS